MFPHHFAEMVLGWRASFPFPNSKLVRTRRGSNIQKVGKRTVPQKRPQKSRPQIQKGLLNQKDSGKKLSVVQGFSAEKALQEKLPDVQAFPYSVLNKGYLLNQKASGEKLSTLRTGLSYALHKTELLYRNLAKSLKLAPFWCSYPLRQSPTGEVEKMI